MSAPRFLPLPLLLRNAASGRLRPRPPLKVHAKLSADPLARARVQVGGMHRVEVRWRANMIPRVSCFTFPTCSHVVSADVT